MVLIIPFPSTKFISVERLWPISLMFMVCENANEAELGAIFYFDVINLKFNE